MLAHSFIRGCLHVSLGLWLSAYWCVHVVLCMIIDACIFTSAYVGACILLLAC